MNLVEPIRDLNKIEEFRSHLPIMYRLIWDIGSRGGLRVSDVLNLNIDIIGKEILTVREQKTGKLKKFPIPSDVQNDILKYYQDVRKNQWVVKDEDDNAFFVTQKHCRVDRIMTYKQFQKAASKSGIENLGTHTMRKTFGYHHYQQNHDITMLQLMLNHSSPQITLRYIGVTEDEMMKSYKNLKMTPENLAVSEKLHDLRNLKSLNQKLQKENKELIKLIGELIDKKLEQQEKTLVDTLDYMQKKLDKKLDIILKELHKWD